MLIFFLPNLLLCLNSPARERKIAHAVAEKYNLLHQSTGIGSSRALLLAKDEARAATVGICRDLREDIRRAVAASEWTPASVPKISTRGQPPIQERPIAKYLGVDVKRFSRTRLGEILSECTSMTPKVSTRARSLRCYSG